MRKTKDKYPQQRKNRWLFLALWVAGHGFAWLPFFIFTNRSIIGNGDADLVLFTGGFIGGITALTQYLLMRWHFERNIRAWVPVSLVVSVLGAIYLFLPLIDLPFTRLNFTAQLLALFLPAALAQIILLWWQVRHAWLWALATIAATAIFGTTFFGLESIIGANGEIVDFMRVFISYGLFAMTTGMSLMWLFGMSQRTTERLDTDEAEQRLVDGLHDQTPDDQQDIVNARKQMQYK